MKIKLIVTAAITITVLAACGGGHNDNNSSAAATGPDSTIQGDAFLSQVNAVVGASDETSDPKATDAITATSPETNEAAPLI